MRARAHILESAAISSRKETYYTGGIRPRDRAFELVARTTLPGCPTLLPPTSRRPATSQSSGSQCPFSKAFRWTPEEHDRYARFDEGTESVPLIDHLERALDKAITQGSHGLPLIGSGDWNDGMDRVGAAGRGESVWLGWFLAVTADLLADMDRRLGHQGAAKRWAQRANELRARVEESGWDGGWYRRAYDDEGDPLGSARNEECRIDSISQSWAIFAGGQPDRTRLALDAARRELIDPVARLVRLLWPPFDKGLSDPGYIKAYPPGTRENGGQYSHAAAWLGLAFAKAGQGETAHSIFSMISPVERPTERYRVEPYVVAGDISAAEPRAGQGGWTWYSGAAAWTWRLGVEGILGLTLRDGELHVDPCLPPGWGGYNAVLRRPADRSLLK
jgi:cyclic beta-1,2-glucan synthetase